MSLLPIYFKYLKNTVTSDLLVDLYQAKEEKKLKTRFDAFIENENNFPLHLHWNGESTRVIEHIIPTSKGGYMVFFLDNDNPEWLTLEEIVKNFHTIFH